MFSALLRRSWDRCFQTPTLYERRTPAASIDKEHLCKAKFERLIRLQCVKPTKVFQISVHESSNPRGTNDIDDDLSAQLCNNRLVWRSTDWREFHILDLNTGRLHVVQVPGRTACTLLATTERYLVAQSGNRYLNVLVRNGYDWNC